MQYEALIKSAQGGDKDAFEQLILAHQDRVYSLCLRLCGDPDDAMDLSQEAFFRAWRALGQFQFEAEFSTWLYRLTRNLCIDFLRRQKRQRSASLYVGDEDDEAELPIPDTAPGPEEQAEARETRQALAAAVAQLPEDQRQILLLRVVGDQSYEQIGEILGLKIGTVKSRLARARISLKKILQDGNLLDFPSSNECTEKK